MFPVCTQAKYDIHTCIVFCDCFLVGLQTVRSIIIITLVSVPNGTHDGRINREHVCVRVGERNEKEKKSLVIKVKFKKSSTRLKWLSRCYSIVFCRGHRCRDHEGSWA